MAKKYTTNEDLIKELDLINRKLDFIKLQLNEEFEIIHLKMMKSRANNIAYAMFGVGGISLTAFFALGKFEFIYIAIFTLFSSMAIQLYTSNKIKKIKKRKIK